MAYYNSNDDSIVRSVVPVDAQIVGEVFFIYIYIFTAATWSVVAFVARQLSWLFLVVQLGCYFFFPPLIILTPALGWTGEACCR